jgi:hypothetical protein
MIQTPTVLILGAGASYPYGYPLGGGLIKEICNNIGNANLTPFVRNLNYLGSSQKEIIKFKTSLELSGKNSVDAFLEHRQEFIKVGKEAIASVLIGKESESKLFQAEDSWYKYFYNKLNTSIEQFDQNRVSIITFNYNRSLEHYLYTALINSYPITPEQCAKKISGLKFIHLHGQLSSLPWQSKLSYTNSKLSDISIKDFSPLDFGRTYSNKDFTVEDIRKAADGIKIIHEEFDYKNDEAFIEAKEVISRADRIYFMGFGYNETNITRLQIPKGKNIVGTTFGLESGEIRSILKLFKEYGINAKVAHEDAFDFLRRSVDWD